MKEICRLLIFIQDNYITDPIGVSLDIENYCTVGCTPVLYAVLRVAMPLII